jgi:hypothetical protein
MVKTVFLQIHSMIQPFPTAFIKDADLAVAQGADITASVTADTSLEISVPELTAILQAQAIQIFFFLFPKSLLLALPHQEIVYDGVAEPASQAACF